ncbi:MAG: hypothetical protein RIB03_00170 [Henriciella sp.]|uniref:hypothetical protein n=1 Tax=Henriciella sp. TaxID=1968823 RepID=UPI0032F0663F
MTDPLISLLDQMPIGRMLAVRVVETGLRTGLSYDKAAAKARVSKTTAAEWAALLGIRKKDLAAETPEMRRARHASWALALAELGRMDEAAAWETETRRLETTLSRIDRRAAVSDVVGDFYAAPKAFLAKVAGTLESGGAMDAWAVVFDYFLRLRTLGAALAEDGKATWPEGVPDEVPPTPPWLPCDPWAVEEEDTWEAEVGAAVRLL